MGRKLDALLGRNYFRTCKLKVVTKLAISRITILRRQRQARYSQAKSDVIDILRLQQHERALIRVELVMKDGNMLDALDMMENYCQFLIDRVLLLQNNKECPDELKEAISSLIFASSRCAEFPELQEIRGIFQLRFGKEFVARAIELRNSCGVNPKIIQKFSARQTTVESRIQVLRSIASEVHITLDLKLHAAVVEVIKTKEVDHHQLIKREDSISEHDQEFSSDQPSRAGKKYVDVAAAVQEAFESAAYAATAARAAFELSRSQSHNYRHQDHDDTSCSDSESDEKSTQLPGSTWDIPSELERVSIGRVAESPTTMDDNQIVLYEAYQEQEGENDHQLHGNNNIPAQQEHHNLDQESGRTLEWHGLKHASDRHTSNFVEQLHVPQPTRLKKNTHK